MVKIEINNQQSMIELNNEIKKIFEKVARTAAELEGYSDGAISFALVENNEIQKLNKKFRGKDAPTDVLSFEMDESILGDVVISTEKAAAQAEEYGHSLERELGYLALHGVLHLMGYDHESTGEKKEMRQKEEIVLRELNLNRD